MKNILIIILSLLTFVKCGETAKEYDSHKKIEQYLTELENTGLYGSVLVELYGELIISKGYGFSDKENRIKNSPSTVYDIGSITKQFTASAILKLEMQGKLSTEYPLSKYFDTLPNDKENITIHDLLRHQSGLISNVGGDYEKISEEDFLIKVFSSQLQFNTGTNFSYSNVGYSLLAMIIEKVSGQNYETYCYKNLWKPAQMEMTGYTRPKFDPDFIAVGYLQDDGIWGKPTGKEWDNTSPYWHLKGNGGILSTTEDLYKWHKCLMTELVLSKKAKQKLYHPKLRDDESENSIYAYGWDVSQTERMTRLVWHNGSNRIFYADFLRYIDENITLIMLTNKSHPNFNNLCFDVSRIIFNPLFNPEIPIHDNIQNRNFTNHILNTIGDSGLEKAIEEFNKREESVNLLEFKMRDEGFAHIDNNQPEIAMLIFEMNVYAYPNSAKALQGLGEGFMETGKNELALKYFKESISINPYNRFVNEMIKELEK